MADTHQGDGGYAQGDGGYKGGGMADTPDGGWQIRFLLCVSVNFLLLTVTYEPRKNTSNFIL